jgi:hypothetical protein
MRALVQFTGRRKNWLLAGVAFIGVIGIALSYPPGFPGSRRAPTEHETVLYYFAQNVGETALCDRISWTAYQSYSVMFGGGGASFYRSDCYERVAQARHDASICWQVRPLIDLDPLSSGYSALSCRRNTKSRSTTAAGLSDDLLLRTFEQLGYDIDQLQLEGVTPPAIRLRDVYLGLERDATVLARAQRLLTDPAASLRADDKSYLAQLAAVGTVNPDLCSYIPAEQRVGQIEAPFRDWCFYAVAYDTQDVRVCERITPAAAEAKVLEAKAAGVRPEIAEQLGLHVQCNRSGKHLGPRSHYGPEVPGDDAQTQRLLAALGVVVPSAHDWSASERAAFFQQFVFALWPSDQPDARRDAARAKLVGRLLALPGDS